MTTEPTTHLTPEQQQALEASLRQAISLVQTLCAALNKPSPLKTREERRQAHVAPPQADR